MVTSARGAAPAGLRSAARVGFAALLLAAACTASPEPVTAPPTHTPSVVPPRATALVAPDPAAVARITADVKYLASPELAGRGTGEPGAKMAADYVAKRFGELGLTPLGDAAGGAPGARGFLQELKARIGVKTEAPRLSTTWPKGGGDVPPDAMITAEGSASGEVSGELVFVGHGITASAVGWDDYAGGDMTGKVVVVLDGAPKASPLASAAASPHGAAASPHGAAASPHGAAASPHGAAASPHGAAASPHGAPHGAASAKPAAPSAAAKPPAAAPAAAQPAPNPHGAAAAHGAPDPARALRDFGSVRYKLRTAREHKAAGVIIVAADETLPAAPADATSMGVPAVVMKLGAAQKLLAAGRIDVAKVRADNKALKKPVVIAKSKAVLATQLTPIDAQAWNVVGAIRAREGSKAATEWVVVGAHYDHLGHGGTSASRAPGVREVHFGADDNASGTALLLEVGRRLKALPQAPERNVALIAFGAEEIGTIGSRWFVENPPVPIGSVTAMINADMVGRLRGKKIVVDGVGTSAAWPEVVRTALAGLELEPTFGNEGFGASDHMPFTVARVPVTFLFTGVHDDYHKPTDTPDKLNYAGIEQIATLATRLTQLTADRSERLAFVDAPSSPHGGMSGRGSGMKVSMGTLPDYAFQGKGMRLSGVRPDAPAARGGMQAGDVVVKVDKHDVGNVHDFMFALGELEPGREIVIEVERDGKRVPLKVVPAPGR
jgi:Zn-dependent M28 family amino/carboxypeptidase